MRGKRLETDEELRAVLLAAHRVAVVGLSPKPHRDSHRVAAYLQGAGYTIVPVHPIGGEILGEAAYPNLTAMPSEPSVDLVDVFRRGDALPALVAETAGMKPGTLWLQFGITHAEAEEAALEAGWDLVVDRCMLVEHRRLVGG